VFVRSREHGTVAPAERVQPKVGGEAKLAAGVLAGEFFGACQHRYDPSPGESHDPDPHWIDAGMTGQIL
jgi:hypothetical protein